MIAQRIKGYEQGHVMLENFSLTQPQKDEVLIQTVYSTISPGTELAWLNHMENTPGEYPYYPGYSCTGRVIAKGSEVTGIEIGTFVAARSLHCSHFITNASDCIPIQQNFLKSASAYRLASISLQGVRKADLQLGDNAAVLGLGAIGNLAAQLLYIAGAANVTGFDFIKWRRSLAARCNILKVVENAEDPEFYNQFEVVVEATGSPAAINTALKIVKPLGTVVLLGSTRGLTQEINFYQDVHRKGITIVGAHEMFRSVSDQDRFGHFRSNGQDETVIINFLQSGRLLMEPLISELVAPRNAQRTYDRLLHKEENLMLAAFDWNMEE